MRDASVVLVLVRNNRFVRHTMIAVLTFTMLTAPRVYAAGAMGVVFDPTNYVQNTVSAVQSVMMELQMVEDYMLQVQKYKAMVQNMKNLPDDTMNQMAAIVNDDQMAYQNYRNVLKDMQGDLSDMRKFMDDVFARRAASNLTWDQWMEREQNLARLGHKQSRATFTTADKLVKKIDDDMRKRATLQNRIQMSEGVQQSAQITNQYLDMIAGQNAQLQQLAALDVSAQARKNEDEAAQRKSSAEAQDRYRKEVEQKEREFAERVKQQKPLNSEL